MKKNYLVSDNMNKVPDALSKLYLFNADRCYDLSNALSESVVDGRVGRNRAKLDKRATDILNLMRGLEAPIQLLMKDYEGLILFEDSLLELRQNQRDRETMQRPHKENCPEELPKGTQTQPSP